MFAISKLYAVNKMASGTFQRSTPVVGTNVVQYSGKKYSPARKCVWSIGYHNAILGTTGTNTEAVTAVSAGGSIEVNQNSYAFVPGLVDLRVHNTLPGGEHRENWDTLAQAAISGGVFTLQLLPTGLTVNAPQYYVADVIGDVAAMANA